MVTIAVLTGFTSLVFCWIYLQFARRLNILDRPNERSSHSRPTPHGGGIALMIALLLGAALLHGFEQTLSPQHSLLMALTAVLVILGAVDDLLGLAVFLRLGIYGVAAVVSAVVLVGEGDWEWRLLSIGLAAFVILWHMNLFNFMDGIDGLAASQAIFVSLAAALLLTWFAEGSSVIPFCLLLAASHLGFLCWNWQPARMFMGDAGSVSTGFLLAALAVWVVAQQQLPMACWLILPALFITDATFTLIWRASKGQPFTRPHRLHAYQRLSQRWGSHRAVVLFFMAINLVWLLPLAWLAAKGAYSTPILVILAYLPLVAGMVKVVKLT